jgi:hypothetical protein
MLCSFYSKAQIQFFVDKITFDKIVEHRDPPHVLVERHTRAPFLSMDCRIINHTETNTRLVLDLEYYRESRYDTLPKVHYSFKWKGKKRFLDEHLATLSFPYELSKKKTIVLQPNDTLKFTLKNSFLFVRLYNKLFPQANQTDRKLTLAQLFDIIPSLQIKYVNKYAKEEEIKELNATILPMDKLTLEAEPLQKEEPKIIVYPEETNKNLPSD